MAQDKSTASDRQTEIQSGREQRAGDGGRVSRTRAGNAPTASSFPLMRRMAEDMNRLFDQFGFGGRLGTLPSLLAGDLPGGTGSQALWVPDIEMFQRNGNLVVRADLPGLSKDDVNVEVDDGVLTISGERKHEEEEERDGFYRSERSYGHFYRSIPLPDGVNADQVEASFRDGVLEITVPAPKQ